MPIYNVEKYLEEALLSIINQTLPFINNIQLVLVNDGSTDNSDNICKKYKALYPNNIIYIAKENEGVSSARNAGLKFATGKYINFMDSDDYFSKNALIKVKEFFDKHKNKTDVVAINIINFEKGEGSWINKDYFKNTQLIDLNIESNFMQTSVCSSFIKNKIAKKYKFDNEIKLHEDSHYLYRIFCGKPFCGVISDKNEDAVYWHRVREDGTSATQNIKHKTNILNTTKKVFAELVKYYIKKHKKLPDFIQTFLILEFNYYVINNILKYEFTPMEKKELEENIKYILDNINNRNILHHFVLSEEQKEKIIKVKDNTLELFNSERNS